MSAFSPGFVEVVATVLFALAVVHTFSTKYFEIIAERHPRHAGIWHLLGEVEVVFGFWAMVLMLFMAVYLGKDGAVEYLDSRNFTEPMFVFVIMVVAGSRPILVFAKMIVAGLARLIPVNSTTAIYFLSLAVVPLLGSFITEPAAMTLAALMLRDNLYRRGISTKLKYATLGVLFVNVSIGGVLTPFAAPPVLMVAATWGWDIGFMLTHFGWKAALAVSFNALAVTLLFHRELKTLHKLTAFLDAKYPKDERPMPIPLIAVHLAFLTAIVVFAHHPVVFMSLFLFFLGVATAYERFQDRLILREGLLVAFFLGGLVTLGGMQQWWLQELLGGMSADAVYYGAAALTAITDNAALTYLGSLVQGLSDEFKYSLVAGAVAGGGLTVIANAPNPAGFAILRDDFENGAINALGLLVAAALPTLVALAAFKLL
ncbi:MAG: putative Na+/H+ antiporter [Pseudomonadota bacterium]|nr:MAG: hypothetical protein DIU74_02270 [Pseudomonadota bacterium]